MGIALSRSSALQKLNLWSQLQAPLPATSIIIGAVLLTLDLSMHKLISTPLYLLSTIPFLFPVAIANAYAYLDHCYQRARFDRAFNLSFATIFGLTIGIGIVALLTVQADSASAQFYVNAEKWMTANFKGQGGQDLTPVISLIFNFLRAILLIYLAVSIIRVVQARQQESDWQELAKTPIVILVVLIVGDFMAGLIIGNAAGA